MAREKEASKAEMEKDYLENVENMKRRIPTEGYLEDAESRSCSYPQCPVDALAWLPATAECRLGTARSI